jgi:hypothetical protein
MVANEHSEEFIAFTKLVDRILSVSHSETTLREREYKRKAALNPRKREDYDG